MNRLITHQIIHISKSNPVILYKKLDSDMKSPYQNFQYALQKTYSVEEFNKDVTEQCTNGRIYSVSKNELSNWSGERVFKVYVWGACILETNNKIGSQHLRIVKELKTTKFIEYMDSEWAYNYCAFVKDEKKLEIKSQTPDGLIIIVEILKIRKKLEIELQFFTGKTVIKKW